MVSAQAPHPPYCLGLGSGDINSAPARKAPETPERNGRTPGMSSAVAVAAAVPDCGAAAVSDCGAALAVSVGVTGLAAPEVPGDGLFGAEPGLPGLPPGAVEVFG